MTNLPTIATDFLAQFNNFKSLNGDLDWLEQWTANCKTRYVAMNKQICQLVNKKERKKNNRW